ncbi:YkvA family protein [Novosphingobium sp. NPDC080210]|uniref:YkvA family protein n=1 Tax=Novosphingobium sp. NPDC080210 TaxID=3390596 RepID=UPI003D0764DD
MARLNEWARALKRDVLALWFAARDPRVPWYAKLLAGLVAAYALSPIDLIPDFIPVLGLLDDLLIVPAGIWLSIRLIPPAVFAQLRAAAQDRPWPVSRLGLALVLIAWLIIARAVIRLLDALYCCR